LAAFKDPGYVKKEKDLPFERLTNEIESHDLCPHCEIVFTPDIRHCYTCNACIDHFDHHCHWINNCVGRGNHPVFYCYIVALQIFFFRIDYIIARYFI